MAYFATALLGLGSAMLAALLIVKTVALRHTHLLINRQSVGELLANLGLYEVAALTGDTRNVAQAAAIALREQGRIRFAHWRIQLVAKSKAEQDEIGGPGELHPVEHALLAGVEKEGSLSFAGAEAAILSEARPVFDALRRSGLAPSARWRRITRLQLPGLWLATLGIGILAAFVSSRAGLETTFAVTLIALAGMSVVYVGVDQRLTLSGREAIITLRQHQSTLPVPDQCATLSERGEQKALAFSLFGGAALAGPIPGMEEPLELSRIIAESERKQGRRRRGDNTSEGWWEFGDWGGDGGDGGGE